MAAAAPLMVAKGLWQFDEHLMSPLGSLAQAQISWVVLCFGLLLLSLP